MTEEYLKEDGYFRVIKIISELEIIINAGTMQGLNEGDDINIIVPGDNIVDPFDDNKKLGSLDFIKDILKIKTITPYYSICHKTKTEVVKRGVLSQGASALNAASLSGLSNLIDTTIEVEVPLDIVESEISNGYPSLTNSKIVVGDYARKRF